MAYTIRRADHADVSHLAKLLEDYTHETYHHAWNGSVEQLEGHLFANDFELLVAEISRKEIIAFVAWINTYDLHHCMKGGDIIDFYVSPPYRGRSPAALLITSLAAQVQKDGGRFLKGGAVENGIVRRLYKRVAMCLPNGDCYISGRAFRHLADLSGSSWREIAASLPDPAWNHEP